jgi:alkylation response protein AidB-like acyl-CoA dehydrogenase
MDFLLSKEQTDIITAAREFAEGEFPERALEFDRTETFDEALWKKASDLGFVGIYIPEKYEGPGFGYLEASLVNEEFWTVDPGCGISILASTFGSEMLLLYGNEEQKKTYLPPLCTGKAISGCAITEPDAGSDVTMASTTAVREGDHWVLNGSKTFITNGTRATFIMVFCVTDPEQQKRHNCFSFLLVPTNTPGFKATKIIGKMGIRASDTAQLFFNDVRVPVENLVGRQGQGFYQLMNFLNHTRVWVAAQGVGAARGAMELAIRHVKKRTLFGQTLASFQATQLKLAEMATRIEASRNLCYKAAWFIDQGIVKHELIAMAKWYAGETAVWVANEAVQLHGGYGYIDEYPVQRFYRDAKIVEIYEGAKEVEKMIIAKELL